MNKEPDYDKMIKDLLQEASFRKNMLDFFTITMCAALLLHTKDKPDLFEAAKKKVIETLKPMQVYKDYVKKLITEN